MKWFRVAYVTRYACKTSETIRDTCWKTNHPVATYVTRKKHRSTADVGEIKIGLTRCRLLSILTHFIPFMNFTSISRLDQTFLYLPISYKII